MKENKKNITGVIIAALCVIFGITLIVAAVLCIFSLHIRPEEGDASAQAVVAEKEMPPEAEEEEAAPSPKPTQEPKEDLMPKAESNPGFSLSQLTPAEDTAVYEPADVVEKVMDGITGVTSYRYYKEKEDYAAYSSGTAFVASGEGYVITNAHIVSTADKVELTMNDGSTVEAQMVGFDSNTDIAVLKIPAEKVTTVLSLGNSDTIRVGEYVLAVGNPLSSYSLYGSVSLGIVSGKAREINIDGFTNNYIQTDAALNPGNSGGPLFDLHGFVVGMNSAKAMTAGYDDYGNTLSSEGIGFSIPINDVIVIANRLIQGGTLVRPGVGIAVYTLDADTAGEVGLVPGVLVSSVTEYGPADTAGMKAGDVIVKFNGVDVLEQSVIVEGVAACQVGDTVTFTVYRDGAYLDIAVTVGNMNIFNNQ